MARSRASWIVAGHRVVGGHAKGMSQQVVVNATFCCPAANLDHVSVGLRIVIPLTMFWVMRLTAMIVVALTSSAIVFIVVLLLLLVDGVV